MSIKQSRLSAYLMALAILPAATTLLSPAARGQDFGKTFQVEVPVIDLLKHEPNADKLADKTATRKSDEQTSDKRLPTPDQLSRGKFLVEHPVKSLLADPSRIAENVVERKRIPAAESNATPDNPPVEPGLVKWHADLTAAALQSKTSGKPVFHFQLLGQLDQRFT